MLLRTLVLVCFVLFIAVSSYAAVNSQKDRAQVSERELDQVLDEIEVILDQSPENAQLSPDFEPEANRYYDHLTIQQGRVLTAPDSESAEAELED